MPDRGKILSGNPLIVNAAAGAAGRSVTIELMGVVQSAGRRSSLGAMLGSGAGTAFRKLRGKPGRNQRYFRGLQSGLTAFCETVLGTFRVLFLEVSGFIFLCFSIVIVSAFVREYKKYAMHQVGLERVVLAGMIGAMFFYFGMSSFWRARRKRTRI